MNSMHAFLLLCIFICLLSQNSHPRTWHVKQDGTGDATSINACLALTQPGDTVLVGPGHYLETTIYMEPIHLISEEGPKVTTIQLWRLFIDYVIVIAIWDVGGDCSVIGFTITGANGGMVDEGGGISIARTNALIRDNIIKSNWCSRAGGILCAGDPSPTIENNLIVDNQARTAAAINVSNCSPIIRYNTIVNNYASIGCGGIIIDGESSYPQILNNIIVGNDSHYGGGITCVSDCPPEQITMECNNVWDNSPVNYDNMPDQTGINGNISEDPLFCGIEGSGNYYLQAGSPCAEANVPEFCSGIRIGLYAVDCYVGVEKSSMGKIKSLFRRRGRDGENK